MNTPLPLKNTLAARVFFLSFSLGCALPPVSQSGNDDVTVSSSDHRAPLWYFHSPRDSGDPDPVLREGGWEKRGKGSGSRAKMAPRSSTSTHIHRSTHVHNIMDMLDEHSAPFKKHSRSSCFFSLFFIGMCVAPCFTIGQRRCHCEQQWSSSSVVILSLPKGLRWPGSQCRLVGPRPFVCRSRD